MNKPTLNTFAVHTIIMLCLLASMPVGRGADRSKDLVILDAQGVQNLGIESQVVSFQDFNETLFALGRIQAKPGGHAYVSSRIAGRLIEITAHEGDFVKKGEPVARVESRQAGNPPPTMTLKAPISGLVVESILHLGEPVEPDKAILEIIDLREAYAVAKVPEDKISSIHPDTLAQISIPALPDQSLVGTWVRFGTRADASNATLDTLFLVKDPLQQIRPDMRVEFTLLLETREQVMSVPKEALQGDPYQPFVFVRDFELPNAFLKAPVVTGAQSNTHVEILSGLFPGDQVVTRGAYPLAFAGSGGISLKEALDAAHGHEHNEDGSEMTATQRAAKEAEKAGTQGATHLGPLTWFLGILCLIQWILLAFKAKRPTQAKPINKVT